MKIVKFVVAVLLAIIFSFITRQYLSTINLNIVSEFTPIPHFFSDEALSYKLSLILIIAIYLIIFLYLVYGKYFNFVISGIGVLLALAKYKDIAESHLPVEMAFIPALLEMAKLLSVFMAIGICVQWVVDGGLSAIRLVNNNKKWWGKYGR